MDQAKQALIDEGYTIAQGRPQSRMELLDRVDALTRQVHTLKRDFKVEREIRATLRTEHMHTQMLLRHAERSQAVLREHLAAALRGAL